MSHTRVIYQNEGVFTGPAPSTGYHFLSPAGVLNNNYFSGDNLNLVMSLTRVFAIDYTINTKKLEVKQFGKSSFVNRSNNIIPDITFNLNYYQMGLINEARLGFYVNYSTYNNTPLGEAFYSNNFGVCLISGFINRNLDRTNNNLGWPLTYRDKRNIFVALTPQGQDLNKNFYSGNDSSYPNVLGFGNCYITSYQADASVGAFPTVKLGYLAENMNFNLSGSGAIIPAINPRTRQPLSGTYFNLPTTFQGANQPSVLVPGDITVSITGNRDTTVDFNDIKIQSYSINMNLARQNLNSINFALPVDRQINLPVLVNVNFNIIVGDSQTGNLINAMNRDDDYGITIKQRNPINKNFTGIGIQYDFLRARLDNINFRESINNQKEASFSYSTEIDPKDYSKGFFMSGLLNANSGPTSQSYLLQEDGNFILQEDGSKIIISSDTILF